MVPTHEAKSKPDEFNTHQMARAERKRQMVYTKEIKTGIKKCNTRSNESYKGKTYNYESSSKS